MASEKIINKENDTAIDYVIEFMNDTAQNDASNYLLEEYQTVPPEIVKTLRQYVPQEGLTLYRGLSFDTEDETKQFSNDLFIQQQLSSWSRNRDVAICYASNLKWGVVLEAQLGASSILVDITKTPIQEMLGATDEEVLVLSGIFVVKVQILPPEEVAKYNKSS